MTGRAPHTALRSLALPQQVAHVVVAAVRDRAGVAERARADPERVGDVPVAASAGEEVAARGGQAQA